MSYKYVNKSKLLEQFKYYLADIINNFRFNSVVGIK